MKNIYVSYSRFPKFNPDLIRTDLSLNIGPLKVKPTPESAFWASPEDAEFGWKDWTEREEFGLSENIIRFCLADNAKILRIESEDDLNKIPCRKSEITDMLGLCIGTLEPDFDAMRNEGYDGMEVIISNDPTLYLALYGWDADSIVIWNPDVVKVIEEVRKT